MPRQAITIDTGVPRNRAAIYRRVSTGMQVHGQSLDVQHKQLTALARSHGWAIVGDYVDPGVSGAVPGKERPGMKRLLAEIRKGHIDIVMVASLDRLGRTTPVVLDLVATMTKYGVVLTAYREGFDTTTAVGNFMVTLCAALAQLERDTQRARVAEGRAERGRTDGEKGGNLPLGYRRVNGTIAIEPKRAAVVRRIFALKRAGRNFTQIADALNRDGVPPGKGGRQWHPSSVREVVLREKIYRGGRRGDSDMCWPAILGKYGVPTTSKS